MKEKCLTTARLQALQNVYWNAIVELNHIVLLPLLIALAQFEENILSHSSATGTKH